MLVTMKVTTIGAFDAKTHLSQLLDRVERGEEIEITRRGQPVARLVPCEAKHDGESLRRLVQRVREERGSYGITAKDITAWKKEGRK